jgi:hypothetical protein
MSASPDTSLRPRPGETPQDTLDRVVLAVRRDRDLLDAQRRRVADEVMRVAREEGLENGLVCSVCLACWNRVAPMRGLADVDCPNCGAIYADVAFNYEP